jgi:porin
MSTQAFSRALLLAAFPVIAAAPAIAQTATAPSPNPSPNPSSAPSPAPSPTGEPNFWTGLFAPSRTNLLGDMFGLRSTLGNYGISLGLQETSEVLGNVTGGIHRGADYDGLTELSLGLDTQKAFGWEGGTFNVSALQIHGRDLSSDNLETLQTASGIEADRATRLWELWYQQAFLNGQADVKIGQQSIDQEFMVSTYSGLFINTMMGWPMIPSADLYAGAPAYPLSSLGVRLRAQPTGAITMLAGVYDDNPPGGPFNNDSQVRGGEQSGTAFNLNTGALFIAEVQYALNQPSVGQMAGAGQNTGLPGTYKLGAWYDTGDFPDQQFDTTGVSLASPASNGIPRQHHGNYSVYGLIDQMVWRPDPQGPESLGVFVRVMGAPDDRNLINFSADAGLTLKAPLPTRDNDTVGIGYGLANVSPSASALDSETASVTGTAYPVRSSESFIELTYQYQIAPWWQVQPDLQYVFMPGGGIPNPLVPGQRIGNELVLGLRTQVTF